MATPYTYLIGWTEYDMWYYGCRYSKDCHPNDLWNPYKTSSKHVKQFVLEYGNPNVIKIHNIFATKEEAKQLEERFLTWIDAKNNPKWLNKHNGGKTFKCEKHSIKTKMKIRNKLLDRKRPKEFCNKNKINHLGNLNSNKDGHVRRGAILSKETKNKISNTLKGINPGKWWNDGKICKRAKISPGPNFILGRL